MLHALAVRRLISMDLHFNAFVMLGLQSDCDACFTHTVMWGLIVCVGVKPAAQTQARKIKAHISTWVFAML